jgi:hypothetical protein
VGAYVCGEIPSTSGSARFRRHPVSLFGWAAGTFRATNILDCTHALHLRRLLGGDWVDQKVFVWDGGVVEAVKS